MPPASELAPGRVGYGGMGGVLTPLPVERKQSRVGARDALPSDPAAGPATRAHAEAALVDTRDSLAAPTAKSDVIVSTVAAPQDAAVAEDADRLHG